MVFSKNLFKTADTTVHAALKLKHGSLHAKYHERNLLRAFLLMTLSTTLVAGATADSRPGREVDAELSAISDDNTRGTIEMLRTIAERSIRPKKPLEALQNEAFSLDDELLKLVEHVKSHIEQNIKDINDDKINIKDEIRRHKFSFQKPTYGWIPIAFLPWISVFRESNKLKSAIQARDITEEVIRKRLEVAEGQINDNEISFRWYYVSDAVDSTVCWHDKEKMREWMSARDIITHGLAYYLDGIFIKDVGDMQHFVFQDHRCRVFANLVFRANQIITQVYKTSKEFENGERSIIDRAGIAESTTDIELRVDHRGNVFTRGETMETASENEEDKERRGQSPDWSNPNVTILYSKCDEKEGDVDKNEGKKLSKDSVVHSLKERLGDLLQTHQEYEEELKKLEEGAVIDLNVPVDGKGCAMFISGQACNSPKIRENLITMGQAGEGYFVKLVRTRKGHDDMLFFTFKDAEKAVDFSLDAQRKYRHKLAIGIRADDLDAAVGFNGVDYYNTTVNSLSRVWYTAVGLECGTFVCSKTNAKLADKYNTMESQFKTKGICISHDGMWKKWGAMKMFLVTEKSHKRTKSHKSFFDRADTIHIGQGGAEKATQKIEDHLKKGHKISRAYTSHNLVRDARQQQKTVSRDSQ